MHVATMNASVGSYDSDCDASESDLSPDPDCQSDNSCHGLEDTEPNPRYSGSSTPSDLSSTSMESFNGSEQSARAIVPDHPSSKSHDEFQYTTVTPVCYRYTEGTNNSTESPSEQRRSIRPQFFQSGNYGLGEKRTVDGKENRTNISNNDNDYEMQGTWPCGNNSWALYSDDPRDLDAVVMPCCDEPTQNFHFEQSRFPRGCLDIVLNGNEKCFESDTACSDICRESGCESEDTQCFRYSMMDGGSGDPCSGSWCSLNSFEGCDGLEEIVSAFSDPVDCFEDELLRDDVELLPVSVSLQSLSSSVGVDVRCADGVFCVDTAICNSNEGSSEDEAIVDMTISAAKDCSCSEDEDSPYEVGLINNYIRCSDDRSIDEDYRMRPSFGTTNAGDIGIEYPCRNMAYETTPDGKRIMEQEQDACWRSEASGRVDDSETDKRKPKSNLPCARSTKRPREKTPSGDRDAHSKRRKSVTKNQENKENKENTESKTKRQTGANVARRKSRTEAAVQDTYDSPETSRSKTVSKIPGVARKKSTHRGTKDVSREKSVSRIVERREEGERETGRGGGFEWANSNDPPPSHYKPSGRQKNASTARKKSSHKGTAHGSRKKSEGRSVERGEGSKSGNEDGDEWANANDPPPPSYSKASVRKSRTRKSRGESSSSKHRIDRYGSSIESGHRGTQDNSIRKKSSRAKESRESRRETSNSRANSGFAQTNQTPNENEFPRNFHSMEAAGKKSQSVSTPASKALSEPAKLDRQKSGTKRAFRVEKKKLKAPAKIGTSYHEPHEASEENDQSLVNPEPLKKRSTVQADAKYHQSDIIVMASTVPSKPIDYGPASLTYLAAGEFFGRPFRRIPFVYPVRAVISYEDDHGLRKNRTTASVARKYNRAQTNSNSSFVEQASIVPPVRSSRVAPSRQPTEELTSPLSVASIKYLEAVTEDGEELVRLSSAEAQRTSSNPQSVSGVSVDDASLPRLTSLEETEEDDDSTPPRKQSVSFANINPSLEGQTSMSFSPRRTLQEEDEMFLTPSYPTIPDLPVFAEDSTLNPSELLASVAAASDGDLLRASLLPRPRSDAIGTSVTQVVSRWRKQYTDADLCFPDQDGKDTWVRTLNAKTIHFNKDVDSQTRLSSDCRAVETNKIIYYQKTSCVEPTESEVSCSNYSSDCDCFNARLPCQRSTASSPFVPTVSASGCCGRPQNISSSSTGGYSRRRRVSSSANRSLDAMMRLISSSVSRRFDEGDRNSSNRLLSGDSSLRSGSQVQGEADDLEKTHVEALLASIRSTTKQLMQQQQQHPQRRRQQHQQPADFSESILSD